MTLALVTLFTIALSQLRPAQQWALVATLTVVLSAGKVAIS